MTKAIYVLIGVIVVIALSGLWMRHREMVVRQNCLDYANRIFSPDADWFLGQYGFCVANKGYSL